jgi:serine/threonine protein kinase
MSEDSERRRRPAYGERRVLESLPDIPNLHFGEVIGSGHFSHVYRGRYEGKPVAIKIIERGSEQLIENEIAILQKLRGLPNIVQLLRVIPEPQFMLIFGLIEAANPDDLLELVSVGQLRQILRCVLTALAAAHSRGIIHRDVKFGNILVSPDFRNAVLLDWGCACEISDSMSSKAGSRLCRSPEMLLGHRSYGTTGDIWSVGLLILYFLSDGRIPWRARTTEVVVAKMSHYFDLAKIFTVATSLGLDPIELHPGRFVEHPDRTLDAAFAEGFQDLATRELVDVMNACLRLEPQKRPSAAQLLRLPYFATEDDTYSSSG